VRRGWAYEGFVQDALFEERFAQFAPEFFVVGSSAGGLCRGGGSGEGGVFGHWSWFGVGGCWRGRAVWCVLACEGEMNVDGRETESYAAERLDVQLI
jgi:hypothetical protein